MQLMHDISRQPSSGTKRFPNKNRNLPPKLAPNMTTGRKWAGIMAEDASSRQPLLRLRILATTDLHAHILPWDDLSDRPAPDRGLAQVARLIAEARAEVPGSLLLDNGDFLNGSPLADHIAESRDRALHPMIAAMNRLRYDAATLGNHEFSNGIGFLKRALRQAAFPVVATNIDRVTRNGARRPFLPRQTMIRRNLPDQTGRCHPVQIGVMGFLPPQTALWERRHLSDRLTVRAILAAAREAAQRLRNAGADVIIALSHSGLGPDGTAGEDVTQDENVSLGLAALPGIQAVIAGHTHQIFPLPDSPRPAGAPVVMPGFFGSHLGLIDLDLRGDDEGWNVVGHKTDLRPVAERQGEEGSLRARVSPDPAIAETAHAATQALRRRASEPVGRCSVALQSYFALIGHSAIQSLLAEAQLHNMQRLLSGRPEADLPMVVAVAPFKAGGRGGPSNYIDIPAGPLTARNIADLYIHPNSPVALRVSGAELMLWLERAVSLFCQISPGAQDAPLIDRDFPAYNFDMIHGLTYGIDLTQPARFDSLGRMANPSADRIRSLCYNGQPVDPNGQFLLITNSYRASGGAGFAGTDPARVVMEETRPLRRVLQEHIAARGTVAPLAKSDWHFLPMPGTTAQFDTGPGAEAHAAALPRLSPIGPCPTGFLRFRLHL